MEFRAEKWSLEEKLEFRAKNWSLEEKSGKEFRKLGKRKETVFRTLTQQMEPSSSR